MYTSGCPKSQKMCCQRSGSPPASAEKNGMPNSRQKSSCTRPTVRIGSAKTNRKDTTSVIHVNTGIRISVMPGARMLRMVMMKLNAAASEEIPSTSMPRLKKSMAALGEYSDAVRLA